MTDYTKFSTTEAQNLFEEFNTGFDDDTGNESEKSIEITPVDWDSDPDSELTLKISEFFVQPSLSPTSVSSYVLTLSDLEEKIAEVSLHSTADQAHEKAREAFVQAKLNPTHPKEKEKLAQKLALTFSEKQANELSAKQEKEKEKEKEKERRSVLSKVTQTPLHEVTVSNWRKVLKIKKPASKKEQEATVMPASSSISGSKIRGSVCVDPPILIRQETKLAAYRKELEREFDELTRLKSQETENLENLEKFANEHFHPETPVRGWFESEEASLIRHQKENEARRKEWIRQKGGDVLLNALRAEIRKNPESLSEGLETLDKEEKAQAILSLFYQSRRDERNRDVMKIAQDRATPVARELNAVVGGYYRAKILVQELGKERRESSMSSMERKKRSVVIIAEQAASKDASEMNRKTTEDRVLAGRAKAFKRLV